MKKKKTKTRKKKQRKMLNTVGDEKRIKAKERTEKKGEKIK